MIDAELALQRFLDQQQNPKKEIENPLINQQLTAVVKTFERPQLLRRLVKSIRSMYPLLPIIVVDDSKERQTIADVKTIHLPFNQGLAAGRNAALSHVQTKYFLLLDDDFVFFRKTILDESMAIIEGNPVIDILGGMVVDLPFFATHDYREAQLFPTEAQPTLPQGSSVAGLPVLDMVANFFIGRTDQVRSVGWDPNLRKMEHTDFFTRAKGVLTTVYNKNMQILHARTPFDSDYMMHREDDMLERGLLLYRYSKGLTQPKDNNKTKPEN